MELLTISQVCEKLKVSRTTLAIWRMEGRGPAYCKVSAKSVLYPVTAIDKYLSECLRGSTLENKTVGQGVAR